MKIKVNGNLTSLKASIIKQLEEIYTVESEKDQFLSTELAASLAELTSKINREIAVYINRRGSVVDVSVGDSATVSLSAIKGRRNSLRLSGIRCIHTHPNGDGRLSAVDVNAALNLKLDAMVALGVKEGLLEEAYVGIPTQDREGLFSKLEMFGPIKMQENEMDVFTAIILERDKAYKEAGSKENVHQENAILVGLEETKGRIINGKTEGERLLDELEELAETAGVEVLDKVLQRKTSIDKAYYLGKGKIEEINLLRQAIDADLIIFDDELSGAQVRNIEGVVGVKVIDRTTLILDIFASRAGSIEGKLQVELAQLKYRLPRLIGLGGQLSRLGGGIGTRGPGEKKLETDRRHIKRRITTLEAELDVVGRRRNILRQGRRKNDLPTIALVGYTNVGKSSLLNTLCTAEVFAENKLFATLDPTMRKLCLGDGREVLIIDTVGFIRKLPHDLIDAFKSTLEETVLADMLIHVVDSSSEESQEQITVVNAILHELGALNKPVIMALNKVDLLKGKERIALDVKEEMAIEVSALTGQGLDDLLKGIEKMLPNDEEEVNLLIPYHAGSVLTILHDKGKVQSQNYVEEGVEICAVINKQYLSMIKDYIV